MLNRNPYSLLFCLLLSICSLSLSQQSAIAQDHSENIGPLRRVIQNIRNRRAIRLSARSMWSENCLQPECYSSGAFTIQTPTNMNGVFLAPPTQGFAPSTFSMPSAPDCLLTWGGCQNYGLDSVSPSIPLQTPDIAYRTETRTRMVTVTRTRLETKTRLVPYITCQSQSYTIQNACGQLETRMRSVPVTQTRAETYQVQVPYTEQVTQTYQVMVPETRDGSSFPPGVAIPDIDEDTGLVSIKLDITNDLTAIKAVITKKADLAVKKRFEILSSKSVSDLATTLVLQYEVTEKRDDDSAEELPTGRFQLSFSNIDISGGSVSMSRTIIDSPVDAEKLRETVGEIAMNLKNGLAATSKPTKTELAFVQPRVWTSNDDRSTSGSIQEVDGDVVKFLRADGKLFNTPIARFSTKDQMVIREFRTNLDSIGGGSKPVRSALP